MLLLAKTGEEKIILNFCLNVTDKNKIQPILPFQVLSVGSLLDGHVKLIQKIWETFQLQLGDPASGEIFFILFFKYMLSLASFKPYIRFQLFYKFVLSCKTRSRCPVAVTYTDLIWVKYMLCIAAGQLLSALRVIN